MKNLTQFLAMCVLALTAFGANAQGLNHNSFDGAGTIKTYKKEFTFVKNGTASTIADGSVVCHDLSADNGATVGLCSAVGAMAACVVDDSSCTAGSMCKCLVEGYKSNVVFDGSGNAGVAGAAIYADIDGKTAGVTSPAASQYAIGVFLDAVSTSTTYEAYIRL